jgi:hypothetical protein
MLILGAALGAMPARDKSALRQINAGQCRHLMLRP